MHLFADIVDWTYFHWVTIAVVLHFSLSVFTSLHVLLFKENENTSLAWIGLAILSPVVGSLFYWLFGINRIKRAAKKGHFPSLKQDLVGKEKPIGFHDLPENWHAAITAGYNIHPLPYLDKNHVEPLINGDTAYPEMIKAIQNARQHIVLASYIFDYDSLGKQFVMALVEAHQRGVIVNVLLDGIGIGYSWRKSDRALKRRGVKTARFLPAISLTSTRFINLRNHRKILCVDGEIAFVGGMNISQNNLVMSAKHPIDDVHFRVNGPVIDQISEVFKEDWYFATGERLELPLYQINTMGSAVDSQRGTVTARAIPDGPDEYHNRIRWTLISALSVAQNSVKIITPYFIPDRTLMATLHAAALRGVQVEIIVPARSNIPSVNWVMESNFMRIMEYGIRIYQNKRPFDHSKILLIDDLWSFIGSANWDARSLEFNFEMNLECFDKELNAKLTTLFERKKSQTVLVEESDMKTLPIYRKIRNNLFRLFSPYL